MVSTAGQEAKQLKCGLPSFQGHDFGEQSRVPPRVPPNAILWESENEENLYIYIMSSNLQ